MKWKNYLIVCVAVTIAVSALVLWVPGLSQTLEAMLIGFLSANAG